MRTVITIIMSLLSLVSCDMHIGDEPSRYTVIYYDNNSAIYKQYDNLESGSLLPVPDDPDGPFYGWVYYCLTDGVIDFSRPAGISEDDDGNQIVYSDMGAIPRMPDTTYVTYYHIFEENLRESERTSADFIEGETITYQPMEVENFEVVGWYLDEALTEPFVSGMIITEDTTLYAKYKINTYTVNYVINGSSYTSKTVTHGQTAENITVEEEGKTFVGWFTDSACTQSYDFGAVTSDITLYAKYEVKMLTVRFMVDGELYKELKVPYGTALIGENATAAAAAELSHFNVQLLSEKYETVLTAVVEDGELEAEINPAIQKWNDFGLWLGGNWKWLLPVLIFAVIVVVFVIVKIKE